MEQFIKIGLHYVNLKCLNSFTYEENVHGIEHGLDLILYLNNSIIRIPLDGELVYSLAKRSDDVINLLKTKIELGKIDEFVL